MMIIATLVRRRTQVAGPPDRLCLLWLVPDSSHAAGPDYLPSGCHCGPSHTECLMRGHHEVLQRQEDMVEIECTK